MSLLPSAQGKVVESSWQPLCSLPSWRADIALGRGLWMRRRLYVQLVEMTLWLVQVEAGLLIPQVLHPPSTRVRCLAPWGSHSRPCRGVRPSTPWFQGSLLPGPEGQPLPGTGLWFCPRGLSWNTPPVPLTTLETPDFPF